jgi:hypothetical protein
MNQSLSPPYGQKTRNRYKPLLVRGFSGLASPPEKFENRSPTHLYLGNAFILWRVFTSLHLYLLERQATLMHSPQPRNTNCSGQRNCSR